MPRRFSSQKPRTKNQTTVASGTDTEPPELKPVAYFERLPNYRLVGRRKLDLRGLYQVSVAQAEEVQARKESNKKALENGKAEPYPGERLYTELPNYYQPSKDVLQPKLLGEDEGLPPFGWPQNLPYPIDGSDEALREWLVAMAAGCKGAHAMALALHGNDAASVADHGRELLDGAKILIERRRERGIADSVKLRRLGRKCGLAKARSELKRIEAELWPVADGPSEAATESRAVPNGEDDWPKERTYGPWQFRAGQYRYEKGQPFVLNGRLAEILERLAKASKRGLRLTLSALASENAVPASVYAQLTKLRNILRCNHNLDGDPIANEGRGKDATWTVDIAGARAVVSATAKIRRD